MRQPLGDAVGGGCDGHGQGLGQGHGVTGPVPDYFRFRGTLNVLAKAPHF